MLSQSSVDRDQAREDVWLYVDEMSHRTLNTYAAVLAIVEQARRKTSDTRGDDALKDVARRLKAAAAAQRALRPSQIAGDCRLDLELEKMCAALSISLLEPRGVALTLACDPIVLDARRCWQACLIVSELITNAIRHAFDTVSSGEISVAMRLRGNIVSCVVSDDGSACSAPAAGSGTRILDALASYLDGAILRRHTPTGSSVLLVFPVCTQAERAGVPS